jgi:hypothetical protein
MPSAAQVVNIIGIYTDLVNIRKYGNGHGKFLPIKTHFLVFLDILYVWLRLYLACRSLAGEET